MQIPHFNCTTCGKLAVHPDAAKWRKGINHLDHPFSFWEELVPPEICDNIIVLGERKEGNEASVGMGGDQQVDTTIRKSEVSWLYPNDCPWLYDVIWKCAQHNVWEYDIRGFVDNLQYTVYDSADEQHYDWHQDIGPNHNHRKISFVMLLSDPNEYEGGDFEIGQPGGGPRAHTVVPTKGKGSAFLFPSFLSHRVSPVTQGVRRSLVTWIAGPKLK